MANHIKRYSGGIQQDWTFATCEFSGRQPYLIGEWSPKRRRETVLNVFIIPINSPFGKATKMFANDVLWEGEAHDEGIEHKRMDVSGRA